jgi:hypothetical protein
VSLCTADGASAKEIYSTVQCSTVYDKGRVGGLLPSVLVSFPGMFVEDPTPRFEPPANMTCTYVKRGGPPARQRVGDDEASHLVRDAGDIGCVNSIICTVGQSNHPKWTSVMSSYEVVLEAGMH